MTDETMAPQALDLIAEWLAKRTGLSPPASSSAL
jgi:hypothetical protein